MNFRTAMPQPDTDMNVMFYKTDGKTGGMHKRKQIGTKSYNK